MSDTPTTDAAVFECHDEGRKVVDPELAQRFERLLRIWLVRLDYSDPYNDLPKVRKALNSRPDTTD